MKKLSMLTTIILHLANFQPGVVWGTEIPQNETNTYIEYASGWTNSSLANDVKAKHDLLQNNADKENKSIHIKDITIHPLGSAFIIYEVSNKLNKGTSYLEIASGWTAEGLASDINTRLDLLQRHSDNEKKLLKINDIIIMSNKGFAFILYEVSDKISEAVRQCRTYVQHTTAIKASNLTNNIKASLERLQQDAEKENKLIKVRGYKIVPELNSAFILYDISESST